MIRRWMYRCYRFFRDLIYPSLQNSQHRYYRELKAVIRKDTTWLDLGCGHQVFGSWMMKEQDEVIAATGRVVGLDPTFDSLVQHRGYRERVAGSGDQLPFRDAMFDVVSANMVVEHIPDPASVLGEVRRVLRPGGIFIFHTANRKNLFVSIASGTPDALKKPLVFLLEGRKEEDVFQTWYRLNTVEDIQAQAGQSSLAVEKIHVFSSSAMTGMLGPLVALELLYLRFLQRESTRSNLIGILKKR